MNQRYKQPFTFDRVVRIVIGLSLTIALFFLVKKLSGVLVPFLLAWLFAYMLYPVVRFFQVKLKVKNRAASIALAFMSFTAVVGLLIYLCIPPIVEEISRTSNLLGVYIDHIQTTAYIPEDIKTYIIDWTNKIDLKTLLEKENLSNSLELIFPRLLGLISSSFDFIISLFVLVIIFLYTIFILVDYERINSGWLQFIPQKYRHLITNILEDLEKGMNKYYRGQALIAAIVAVLFAVGFQIISLPLGIILGLAMGALNLVPYLSVVMLPVIGFFGFLKSVETGEPFWTILIQIAIVLGVTQMIQDLFLTPKIMGKTMGMKPAVILLSLSIWGALLGVTGMIIALPLTTILASYYKQFIIGDAAFIDTESEKNTPPKDESNLEIEE